MKAKKMAGKVVRSVPVAGSYIKGWEREINDLKATVKQLEARNDEWAAEVDQLRGANDELHILWPVFKVDLIAADYRHKPPKSTYKPHKPPYIINWVVPPVGSVSGGHAVIFYMIRYLEAQGHTCRVYFYDPLGESSLSTIKENLKHHVPIKAELFYNDAKMADCDAVIATSWPTAYPVFNYKGPAKKFYLLQDYEPMFEPSGSYSTLAENTYKMGLQGICTTPFTGIRVKKEFGMDSDNLELGINPDEYHLLKNGPRPKKILFYSRPVTPRRGFELAVLALEVFHKQHPEYEINCIGWDISRYDVPFPYVNHGIISTAELNKLYNECLAGLVMSFTSMSLTVVEMMAAGCMPVMNNGPDSSLVSYRKYLRFAEPNPVALAEKLYEAIQSQEKNKGQPKAVADHAKQFAWDKYNTELQNILVKHLGK